jgi:Xaa-Pro aminopeptidase
LAFIKPLGYDPEKCSRLMAEMELSGIVLTSSENVFYTTGLPVTRGHVNPILFALSNKFPSYSVIHPDGLPTMITWTGAVGGHEFWAKDVRTAWLQGGTTEELAGCIQETFKPGSRIGIESSAPYVVTDGILKRKDGVELVVADGIFDTLRAIKSEDEIKMMRASLEITETTVGRLQREMKPDVTGYGLISKAESILFELGATGVDHTTMAIGKTNPEIPEDVEAKAGDLIILDLGAILHGYASDNRRLAYIGKIPAEMKEKNQTMASMVVETGTSAKPGKTFAEVCGETDSRYAELGMEPMFLSAGHTIGIQTEELWITRDSEKTFENGMVFNIELYTRLESGVFIGTEDTFVVDGGVSKRISRLPHDIAQVGD